MKRLKFLLLGICFLTIATLQAQPPAPPAAPVFPGQYIQGNDSPTGAGGICSYIWGSSSNCINWWYPTVLGNQWSPGYTTIMPGSYDYQFAYTPVVSTIYDTLNSAFNYFKTDTLVGGTHINFNVDQYVTEGAFLVCQLGGGSDSSRTIYLYQGATPFDTVTVTNHKKHTMYVYDGTNLQPVYK